MNRPRGLAEGRGNAQKVLGVYLDIMNKKRNGNKRAGKASKNKTTTVREIVSNPRTMRVSFPYSTRFSLTESAAGVGTYIAFRLNSLYDPNYTGVGSQPLGYDQWSTLFSRSVVTHCDVSVTFINTTASNSPTRFGYYPTAGVTTPSADTDSWAVQPGGVSLIVGGGGTTLAKRVRRYQIHKILGISKNRVLDEVMYQETTSGPAVGSSSASAMAQLVVWIAGVSAVSTGHFMVNLTYHAVLSDAVVLTLS